MGYKGWYAITSKKSSCNQRYLQSMAITTNNSFKQWLGTSGDNCNGRNLQSILVTADGN